MAGYSIPTRESDPVHTVRTIGRLAQMLLELRDEYVRDPRPDTLDQIVRRLDEINRLSDELKTRIHDVEGEDDDISAEQAEHDDDDDD